MGYEVKIFLGESHKDQMKDNGASFFNVASMVDLCKPGYESAIFGIKPDEIRGSFPIYLYDLDGNTQHTEDHYGNALRAIPVSHVLQALREDAKREPYRRFLLALPLVRAFKKHFKGNAYAVLYGY
jgi:hypothetical protein